MLFLFTIIVIIFFYIYSIICASKLLIGCDLIICVLISSHKNPPFGVGSLGALVKKTKCRTLVNPPSGFITIKAFPTGQVLKNIAERKQ